MSFFTRRPSLGKQGFDSGAHKTMENQDLVDGVFESSPDPSISRADFATQGGYRRSKDYSGTTNVAGTAGSGAGSIFGNSSSGSLMTNGGRHTHPSTSSGSIFGSSDPRHSGPEVLLETPTTTSSNPGVFSIGTNDPHRGPALVIDRETSSGSSNTGSSTSSYGNTGIFGSSKTTDSSSSSPGSIFSRGNSSTSADTSSSGSSLPGARGSQHTAGSSMTGGRNTADSLGNAGSSVSNAAHRTAQALRDIDAAVRDTGTAATRGAADSAADTRHGVEGAVRNTGAPAANAVHDTGKGSGILGSNDASRYGAAGSSQSAGSSLGDGATRLAKNVGSSVASGNSVQGGVTSNVKSVNGSAKEAMKDTGSEILGREIGTGVLNAARGTGSGVASSLRDSARESVRDNSSSGSAGSVLRDTGNYGSSSVNSHRTNPHASTNSGTSGASRISDVGTARRGTGPVASTVAAGEPIDKRATIGRSSGDAGHAVGYDVDETLSQRNLRH